MARRREAGAGAEVRTSGSTAPDAGGAAWAPVIAPPSQPTTVLGRTATAPAGSTVATVSSSVVHALPSAPATRCRAAGASRPGAGATSWGSSDTASPRVTTLPRSASRTVSGASAARASREPVSSTRRAGSHRGRGDHHRGPVGEPRIRERDVVQRGLARRALPRRDERGGDAGTGERHRVPRAQAERVDDLGVQPDDAAAGVTGRGGEPRDECDGGSHG